MDGIKNHTKPAGPVEAVTARNHGLAAQADTGAPRPAPDSPSERVTLTEAARALLGAREPEGNREPVDLARIAALRQSIEDGTYTIDAKQVAERLLRMEDEL